MWRIQWSGERTCVPTHPIAHLLVAHSGMTAGPAKILTSSNAHACARTHRHTHILYSCGLTLLIHNSPYLDTHDESIHKECVIRECFIKDLEHRKINSFLRQNCLSSHTWRTITNSIACPTASQRPANFLSVQNFSGPGYTMLCVLHTEVLLMSHIFWVVSLCHQVSSSWQCKGSQCLHPHH